MAVMWPTLFFKQNTMNKKHLPQLVMSVLLWALPTFSPLWAQVCSNDAPLDFVVVSNPANPSECFLQINWGDAMPMILCGNPGSPAIGSTVPEGRRLEFLYATIDGVQYTLYSRLDCPSGELSYGAEANTYITTFDEVDFCLADAERFISLEGVQMGADDFNCLLPNAQTAAPVELAYFKASASTQTNQIEWATSSEENTATFVVEKSVDGKNQIEFLGALKAKGFSSTLEYYEFEDRNPRPLTYYRLRSIDFDGSESASDWIAVARQIDRASEGRAIAPIPLGNEPLEVYYEATTAENIIISISDINGRKMWEERKSLEAGTYNWTFELPDFHQHLLIFRMHTRDGLQTRMIPYNDGY